MRAVADYDDAVRTLYQAPFADFVAERKRLASELKAAGDKHAAAQLAKLQRPPVSAWAVNQLWWREQADVEGLIQLAARVRVGDREASQAHREALAKLRERARRILDDAGNAAAEATLRRVTTTLSAIAAAGGWAPDAPGALSADRDPPGFESLGFAPHSVGKAPSVPQVKEDETPRKAEPDKRKAEAEKRKAEEAERKVEAEKRKAEEAERKVEAEKRKAEEAERQRRLAARERLTGERREARTRKIAQERELARLRAELDAAEQDLAKTQAVLDDIDEQLASL